jgi:hypothetical protein
MEKGRGNREEEWRKGGATERRNGEREGQQRGGMEKGRGNREEEWRKGGATRDVMKRMLTIMWCALHIVSCSQILNMAS